MEKSYYIYSKPNCPWCSMASHLLELNGLAFEEFKEEDEFQRKQILINLKENYNAKDHNTFPAILLIEDEKSKPVFIGGCVDLMDHLIFNGYKTSKV